MYYYNLGTFLLILQGMCDIVAPLLVVIDDEVDELRLFREAFTKNKPYNSCRQLSAVVKSCQKLS